MTVGAVKMFRDQQCDYATPLTHAYEHTSIFGQEVDHPVELMLMCQCVPVLSWSGASSLCMPASPETTRQRTTAACNKPTGKTEKANTQMYASFYRKSHNVLSVCTKTMVVTI